MRVQPAMDSTDDNGARVSRAGSNSTSTRILVFILSDQLFWLVLRFWTCPRTVTGLMIQVIGWLINTFIKFMVNVVRVHSLPIRRSHSGSGVILRRWTSFRFSIHQVKVYDHSKQLHLVSFWKKRCENADCLTTAHQFGITAICLDCVVLIFPSHQSHKAASLFLSFQFANHYLTRSILGFCHGH